MLKAMLLAGVIGIILVACGGFQTSSAQPQIQAPDGVELLAQDILMTPGASKNKSGRSSGVKWLWSPPRPL